MSERAPANNRFMPLDNSGRLTPDRDNDFNPLQELADTAIRKAADEYIASVGEALPTQTGLSTTTRAELQVSASSSSSGDQASVSAAQQSPARIGVVRQREDTPSAAATHAERRTHVNALNNDAIVRDAPPHRQRHIFGSVDQPTTLAPGVDLGKKKDGTRRKSVPGYANQPFRPVAASHTGRASSGTARLSNAGHHAAQREDVRAPAKILVPDSQFPQSSQQAFAPVFKTEDEDVFYTRQQHIELSSAEDGRPRTREMAPSPSPHDWRGNNRPLVGDPSSPPEVTSAQPRRAARADAGDDNVGEAAHGNDDYADDDDMLYEDFPQPAQPAPAPPASPPLPAQAAFTVRDKGVFRVPQKATPRERAAMSHIAPELGMSSIPCKAAGNLSPIPGARENEPLIGLGPWLDTYNDMPGDKVVVEVIMIFGRLVQSFDPEEIIAMLELITDMMFLESFPEVQSTWCRLFSPNNTTGRDRVRPGLFGGLDMSDRMVEIWRTRRFWTFGGGTQLIVYGWKENRSTFVFCFISFRCQNKVFVLFIFREAFRGNADVRAVVARQVANSDAGGDVNAIMDAIAERISLESAMAIKHNSTIPTLQYSVFIDADDLIVPEELEAFNKEVRKISIEHPLYGKSKLCVWTCDPCRSRTHRDIQCLSKLELDWTLRSEVPTTSNNLPPPPPPRRGGFNPGFNGGRKGGRF